MSKFVFLVWTLSCVLPNVLTEDLPTVQIKIIKEAKKCDKIAEAGDFLSVHYTGRFDDENGELFETSEKTAGLSKHVVPKPYKFQLGARKVS